MFENIVIAILLVATWYLAQVAIYLSAKLGYFWIILEEGHAVAIKKNGAFKKMLLAYTGYRFCGAPTTRLSVDYDNLDIYNIEISPENEKSNTLMASIANFILPVRGIRLLGAPGISETSEQVLVQAQIHKLLMDNIVLQGGIPYRIHLLLALQITNPAKALLRVDNYFGVCLEQIYGWSRNEFSTLTFENFTSRSIAPVENSSLPAADKLDGAIARILKRTHELSRRFGVTIHEIQLTGINPMDEEMQAIITLQEIAKQKAAANVTKAQGEAQSLKIVNEAAEKLGNKALRIRELHAIEHASARVTIIGSNLAIPPVLPLSGDHEKN